ncbi:MAG: DUF512 domain-containing protein [Acidimicrobiia bacterium]|nr:DUF512 domain-containing protein [Acidimicrobiia bacterium]
MLTPRITAVVEQSVAAGIGLEVGDELLAVNGCVPKDVIEYQQLIDEPDLIVDVRRDGIVLELEVSKRPGEPLGIQVDSALFDRVRTCDNHCEFCFIYQLPPGLRSSLYLKDDDYRLSFLYGNFTTLTRFTEADLERVVSERLSPLNVSIHAVDPEIRATMLRNRRGASSLRWLRALLDHGIEIHGQVVVCPGVNDASVLEDTLAGITDEYPEMASVCVVPLGVSRYSTEARLRAHTVSEAAEVVNTVQQWQNINLAILGRRLVFAADEYYLLAGLQFPDPHTYEGFSMHEDGVGMATAFRMEFLGETQQAIGVRPGFFAWVEGSPASSYRAPRTASSIAASEVFSSASEALQDAKPLRVHAGRSAPVGLLTGTYGAEVLVPLVAQLNRDDVRVIPVQNRFFGGTTAVAGLLVGEDIARTLADEPKGHRYLLPDVCLSRGLFLDGSSPDDLPRPVEVVPTDGIALRRVLDG